MCVVTFSYEVIMDLNSSICETMLTCEKTENACNGYHMWGHGEFPQWGGGCKFLFLWCVRTVSCVTFFHSPWHSFDYHAFILSITNVYSQDFAHLYYILSSHFIDILQFLIGNVCFKHEFLWNVRTSFY